MAIRASPVHPRASVGHAATGRRWSATIRAPGPSLPPSTLARTPVMDPCACERGPSCTRRSKTTQERALGVPCPSWSARSRPGRGRAPAPRRESAQAEGFVAVVARSGGDETGSGSHLAFVCAAFRSGAHLPFPQAEHGMDDTEGAPSRAGRPVDVASCSCVYAAAVGTHMRCGPAAAVGAALRYGAPYTDPGPSRGFSAFGAPGHTRQAAETLR